MERAENAIIDTVACIVAGERSPAARAAHALGSGVSAEAFRLAAAGHAHELDDYDRPSVAHPSTVLVPVILALAAHRPVSGRAAVAGFVAGLEAMDRMGEAVNPAHYERGWHATGTLGQIGAAVTAGRLIGLGAEQMLVAMTIATSAAASLKAQFGSTGKPLHAGFAAMNGINAALLAEGGAIGRVETLAQFAELFGPGEPIALRPFAHPLAIEEFGLVVKLWPCCGYLGRLVPAAIALSTEVASAEIASIEVEMPARNLAVAGFGMPETVDEARFSAPYCVAAGLTDGALNIRHFTEAAIGRADLRALAGKVSCKATTRQQSPVDLAPEDPDRLTVHLTSGRGVERVCDLLPGSPENPVPRARLFQKLSEAAPDPERERRLLEQLAAISDSPDLIGLSCFLERAG